MSDLTNLLLIAVIAAIPSTMAAIAAVISAMRAGKTEPTDAMKDALRYLYERLEKHIEDRTRHHGR